MKKIILAIIPGVIVLIVVVWSINNRPAYNISPAVSSEKDPIREAKILFVGDMMFDRTIRTIAEKKGYAYLFSCIEDYLERFDLIVGNLEGPITYEKSLSQNTRPGDFGNTSFTFDPVIANRLADGKKAVSLGNNHILDRGAGGLENTKAFLKAAGVIYFGAPGDPLYATTTISGMDIALVNFNQFLGQNDPQKTIGAIWKLKRETDIVVVYAHWGEEYVPATDYQKALAHSFIDAGADAVIGSHPHIYQSRETYKEKPIFYSLGNFIFDQYFSDEVKSGAGAELSWNGELSWNEVFFDIGPDGRTCLKSTL